MDELEMVDQIAESWLLYSSGHTRGYALVQILQAVPSPAFKNMLLRKWFPDCEALKPWLKELREEFLKAGFVTDTDEPLHLPVKVYRAAWEDDDDLESALSWTTDLEIAKIFAQMCGSERGRVLGMHREDARMMIYIGTCTEALGYLTERGESEVIVGKVENIKAMSVHYMEPASNSDC